MGNNFPTLNPAITKHYSIPGMDDPFPLLLFMNQMKPNCGSALGH